MWTRRMDYERYMRIKGIPLLALRFGEVDWICFYQKGVLPRLLETMLLVY